MYYFASDIHLGSGEREASLARERLFVEWLERVSADAKAIFIVGDMFDFWYEYKRVIPKGFARLLGKFAELSDRGVEIHFFSGNHDMWAFDYLETECGVKVHHKAEVIQLYGKRVFVAHGDDIHARRGGFFVRLMNGIFRSKVMRWLFSHLLHPDAALRFGQWWSSSSRKSKDVAHRFLAESEPMVAFARDYIRENDIDYFIFGHNHCAEVYPLNDHTSTVFLGEWIENPVFASMNKEGEVVIRRVDSIL